VSHEKKKPTSYEKFPSRHPLGRYSYGDRNTGPIYIRKTTRPLTFKTLTFWRLSGLRLWTFGPFKTFIFWTFTFCRLEHIRNRFQISGNSVHFPDAWFWSCHPPKKESSRQKWNSRSHSHLVVYNQVCSPTRPF
jgi:hypothetical protein